MKDFNPEVDSIAKEVTGHLLRIYDEFKQEQADPTADYQKGAAMIAFRLGLDYFATTRDALHRGRIVSGGAVMRSALENFSDLLYVYSKPDKYPKAYVESMEKFKKIMIGAATKKSNAVATSRELKQANNWTNTSIEQRLKLVGSSLLNIYDIFSYFSHPNPGSLTFLTSMGLKDGQLNLMKQANCFTALALMKLVISHTDIKSVKVSELEKLAHKLGARI